MAGSPIVPFDSKWPFLSMDRRTPLTNQPLLSPHSGVVALFHYSMVLVVADLCHFVRFIVFVIYRGRRGDNCRSFASQNEEMAKAATMVLLSWCILSGLTCDIIFYCSYTVYSYIYFRLYNVYICVCSYINQEMRIDKSALIWVLWMRCCCTAILISP